LAEVETVFEVEGNKQGSGDAARVLSVLRAYRFNTSSEAALQGGIARALAAENVAFEPEVILTAQSRIDFLVDGGVGIEVKIDGTANEVLRQLMRYAECAKVRELVLVTTRSKHVALASSLRGKPLAIHFIGGLS
jgi:hypothetical protein